jgi:hypothetical protein
MVTFFEFLTILMAQSVSQCLQLLNYQTINVYELHSKSVEVAEAGKHFNAKLMNALINTNTEFERCLMNYNQLKDTVAQYSSLSAWILFAYKGFSLALTCLSVYSAVYFSGTNHYLKRSALIFIFLSCIQLIRLSAITILMGKVYAKSELFKESWTLAIHELAPLNQRKLSLLSPFGFRCGIFYELQPSTVLTYFSILTTYVIVMLQIFNIGA